MGILLKGALFFDAACNMPVRILLLMMGFALYGLNAAQFDRKIYHFEYPDFLQPDESPDWAISQSQQGRTVALVQKGSNPAIGIVVTADADFVNSREHIDRVRRQSIDRGAMERYELSLWRVAVVASKDLSLATFRKWDALKFTMTGKDTGNDPFMVETIGVYIGSDFFLMTLNVSPSTTKNIELGRRAFEQIKSTIHFWTEGFDAPNQVYVPELNRFLRYPR